VAETLPRLPSGDDDEIRFNAAPTGGEHGFSTARR